jgi:DNA segregation ATPase FtsK/SpoIIIE-like protein
VSARGRRKAKPKRDTAWWEAPWLGGLLYLALGAYLALALTGAVAPWWVALQGGDPGDVLAIPNPGGPVGGVLNLALRVVGGGAWAWLVPLLLLAEGVGLLTSQRGYAALVAKRLVPLWLASAAWLAQPDGLLPPPTAASLGGICGLGLGRGFHFLFGAWGGRIFLTFLLLASLLLVFRPWLTPLNKLWGPLGRGFASLSVATLAGVQALLAGVWRLLTWPGRWLQTAWQAWRQRARQAGIDEGSPVTAPSGSTLAANRRRLHGLSALADGDGGDPIPAAAAELAVTAADPTRATKPGTTTEVGSATDGIESDDPTVSGNGEHDDVTAPGPAAARSAGSARSSRSAAAPLPTKLPPDTPVELPSLDLLHDPDHERWVTTPAELDAAADLLESTLSSFGVQGEVKDVRPGPVVTTFEYQPASGIKVSQIVQRMDDLALAMKARSIRMEAPIPGKAAVGIEIPNALTKIVHLKEVLTDVGQSVMPPLAVVLGKDVVGQPVTIDIANLPHLLVAGSTGSGKSVCLNSMICNLLLRNEPSRLRLILIDPKMLEMSVYNGIPHLLLPVVTDPKEALRALKWMVAQMELRYRLLARAGVRDIATYNAKVARGEVLDQQGQVVTEPMPFYLTIVDELADLMIQLGQDFEMPVTRLAQKARAVGIHLVLATQRPSVDVITGVIKANIPCRIAFRVIQRNDSRTILDMNGAEQLLGNGDMLYLQPGRALPVRVHGSFIDVADCEAIVAHWCQYAGLTEEVALDGTGSGDGVYTGDDELFEDARRIVVLHQSGSTSLLQRRLRVGYTRAGRLIDMLEEAGVVGPFTGSKAREVLLKPEDLPDWEGPEAGGAEA